MMIDGHECSLPNSQLLSCKHCPNTLSGYDDDDGDGDDDDGDDDDDDDCNRGKDGSYKTRLKSINAVSVSVGRRDLS